MTDGRMRATGCAMAALRPAAGGRGAGGVRRGRRRAQCRDCGRLGGEGCCARVPSWSCCRSCSSPATTPQPLQSRPDRVDVTLRRRPAATTRRCRARGRGGRRCGRFGRGADGARSLVAVGVLRPMATSSGVRQAAPVGRRAGDLHAGRPTVRPSSSTAGRSAWASATTAASRSTPAPRPTTVRSPTSARRRTSSAASTDATSTTPPGPSTTASTSCWRGWWAAAATWSSAVAQRSTTRKADRRPGRVRGGDGVVDLDPAAIDEARRINPYDRDRVPDLGRRRTTQLEQTG